MDEMALVIFMVIMVLGFLEISCPKDYRIRYWVLSGWLLWIASRTEPGVIGEFLALINNIP